MILGISFMLFLLAVGVATLGMAVSIAVRPTERKVLSFRPMPVCHRIRHRGGHGRGSRPPR